MRRDLDLALLYPDLVALEVVEETTGLRERAGGHDDGQRGHDDGGCHRGQKSLHSHVLLFLFACPCWAGWETPYQIKKAFLRDEFGRYGTVENTTLV